MCNKNCSELYTGEYHNSRIKYKLCKMRKTQFIKIVYGKYRDYDFSYIACLLDALNWIYLYKSGNTGGFTELEETLKDDVYYFNVIDLGGAKK